MTSEQVPESPRSKYTLDNPVYDIYIHKGFNEEL